MSAAPSQWQNPLPLLLRATSNSESFAQMPPAVTGLPVPPHPGAFGVVRKHHVHEGIDLYAPPGTEVRAVEAGTVVALSPFTGPLAGLPWWLDTQVVLVEGASGVVAYGEIEATAAVGTVVSAGDLLGHVVRVLRNDKGRPTSMLHLELHEPGTRTCPEWRAPNARPGSLRDPTPFLLPLAQQSELLD